MHCTCNFRLNSIYHHSEDFKMSCRDTVGFLRTLRQDGFYKVKYKATRGDECFEFSSEEVSLAAAKIELFAEAKLKGSIEIYDGAGID